MLSKLTIVIITYQRYAFLKRLLWFYSSYNIKARILVLDSSPGEPLDVELLRLLSSEDVTWKQFNSNIFFSDKIAQGCKYINTEYVVLCADDDFLFPDALNQCIHFLEAHSDYSSCHGYYYGHYLHSTLFGKKLKLNHFYPLNRSADEHTAALRIDAYLTGKLNTLPFYAVHRVENFKEIWQNTSEVVSDWGLSELFPCAISLCFGKMKVLSISYSTREPNTFCWYDEIRQLEMYSEEKLSKVVSRLGLLISRKDMLSTTDGIYIAKKAFNSYVGNLQNKNKLKISGSAGAKSSEINLFFANLRKRISIRSRLINLSIKIGLWKSDSVGSNNNKKLLQALSMKDCDQKNLSMSRRDYSLQQ